MKIVIIGSVASGTSVAAKARRNNEENEIVIYERDTDISYAICGIPYAIGDEVESFEALVPRDAQWFKKRHNVDIHTGHEVQSINHDIKTLSIKNLSSGQIITDTYDILVFATGATSNVPKVFNKQYMENVFTVRNIDSGRSIHEYVAKNKPNNILVVGAGYIGLEIAEQLKTQENTVTILQRSSTPMSHFDSDMGSRITSILTRNGINYINNDEVETLVGEPLISEVITTSGKTIKVDMVILATGVTPNTKLAESIGVELGTTGAIKTNSQMQTNLENVYAVGDVAESYHRILKRNVYVPLATTANKMGRVAGDVITGGSLHFNGVLGTGIVRLFDHTIAQTGLTEKQAIKEGYKTTVLFNIKPDKPEYMNGKEMAIKAVADRISRRLLGVQIIGEQGVDKRIDVFATALTFNAKVDDLFDIDLAYAPPFSTTKDPVIYTGMALANSIDRAPLMTPKELMKLQHNDEALTIIDTRDESSFAKEHVPGAINIPLANLRKGSENLDKSKKTVVYCNKGVTGNASQNLLLNLGFEEVFNLSGGNKNYQQISKTQTNDEGGDKNED